MNKEINDLKLRPLLEARRL